MCLVRSCRSQAAGLVAASSQTHCWRAGRCSSCVARPLWTPEPLCTLCYSDCEQSGSSVSCVPPACGQHSHGGLLTAFIICSAHGVPDPRQSACRPLVLLMSAPQHSACRACRTVRLGAQVWFQVSLQKPS